MIGYISSIVSFVLCLLVYLKMLKREEPATLGKKSIIPVVLGVVSPALALVLVILFKVWLKGVVVNNLVLRSLFNAFFDAGFTEEFVKFLFALIAVVIVKPKTVYSYSLMFIGVGFGFTLLEEVLYGGGNELMSLARLPGFALHMVFGMLMGVNLGLARYRGSAKNAVAAFVLPVMWHTVYDAATVDNAGLASENDAAIIIALVVDVAAIVMQFVMLSWFKKRSKDYCQMAFASQEKHD